RRQVKIEMRLVDELRIYAQAGITAKRRIVGIRETDGLVLVAKLVAVPDDHRNCGLQDLLRVLCQENIVPEPHAGGCAVVSVDPRAVRPVTPRGCDLSNPEADVFRP